MAALESKSHLNVFETLCSLPYKEYKYPIYKDMTEAAYKIINIAVNNRGLVFGSFVREHLIRKKPWSHIDLWFESRNDMYTFIRNALYTSLFVLSRSTAHPKCQHCILYTNTSGETYPIERRSLIFKYIQADEYILIDVFVNPFLPVNDFDVNQVAYDGKSLHAYSKVDINVLLESIEAGKFNMLNGYESNLKDSVLCQDNIIRLVKEYKYIPSDDTISRLPQNLLSVLGIKSNPAHTLFARPCEHIASQTILYYKLGKCIRECIKCRCRVQYNS